MTVWDKKVSGKFHVGLFKSQKNLPVLVIDLPNKKQFSYLCDIISREEFLRVRREMSRCRQLALNTLGDASEIDPGVLDYSTCELDMCIEVEEPQDDTLLHIDTTPVWSFLFIHSRAKKSEKLSILVSKETERILWRKKIETDGQAKL
jgi:hypothetical protein